jgi:hypothetical protein
MPEEAKGKQKMELSAVRDYNSFQKVFASRTMDVYRTEERVDGSSSEDARQTKEVDATVTVHRDSADPRVMTGIDISEGTEVLQSIIGMERSKGGPAPGVHYIQIYKGHIDENHNNVVDESDQEVTVVTYPANYGQDPSNFDADLQPLESIRILKEE